MTNFEDRSSRIVLALLAMTVLALSFFAWPPDAHGMALANSQTPPTVIDIDGLASLDKSLTLKGKSVNCSRLDAVLPTRSGVPFYSH